MSVLGQPVRVADLTHTRTDTSGGCKVKECNNRARWRVGFKLWPRSKPVEERDDSNCAPIETAVIVCDQHMVNPPATPQDFFSPAGRQRIEQGFARMGKEMPDFDAAVYNYLPLPEMKLS